VAIPFGADPNPYTGGCIVPTIRRVLAPLAAAVTLAAVTTGVAQAAPVSSWSCEDGNYDMSYGDINYSAQTGSECGDLSSVPMPFAR
jgi:hypothetical protein